MKVTTTVCDNCKESYVPATVNYEVKLIPPNEELRIVRKGQHDTVKDICGVQCMLQYVQKFLNGELKQ